MVLTRKGVADFVVGVNVTPPKDLLAAAEAGGIPIWVCGACAVACQIGEEDLVAEATTKGTPACIASVLERVRSISF